MDIYLKDLQKVFNCSADKMKRIIQNSRIHIIGTNRIAYKDLEQLIKKAL